MKKLKVVSLVTLALISTALTAAPIVATAQLNHTNSMAPAISADHTAPIFVACAEPPCTCPDC